MTNPTSNIEATQKREMTNVAASLENVAKIFNHGTENEFTALEQVSQDIYENEFFTLLGPSGCGKTTLLRIISGFEQPTRGTVKIFGEDVSHLAPNKRPVNTVFQHYALFPHLTVQENVGFALRMQGAEKSRIDSVSKETLKLVHMEDFADRKPDQLSGGQKQRVALARALAPHPKVLLLDEPLSALDLKLRQAMRWELKKLQRETGITFIFVTHDQEEALSMSDRIAVISEGRIQQIGTPTDIYDCPANRFVADFIGESNLIEVEVVDQDSAGATVKFPGAGTISMEDDLELIKGEQVTLSIRPEQVIFNATEQLARERTISAEVLDQVYLGNATEFHLRIGDTDIVARAPKGGVRGRLDYKPGEIVTIGFESDALLVLRS